MAVYAKSLFAENYVVTSSVVSMSIAHASGSTIFGDTVDDTHTFTGNITASGNVSGSSTSTASFGYYQGITSFAGADGTEPLFSGSAASTASFGAIQLGNYNEPTTLTITGGNNKDATIRLHNTNNTIGHSIVMNDSSNRAMYFKYHNGSAVGTTYMTFDGYNGNVGIGGAIDPNTDLQVGGYSGARAVTIATGNNEDAELRFHNSNNTIGHSIVFNDETGRSLYFKHHNAQAVGTTYLTVNGQTGGMYFNSNITGSGTLHMSGSITTDSHVTVSGNISGSSTSTGSFGQGFIANKLGIGTSTLYSFILKAEGSNAHEGLHIKTGNGSGYWLIRAEDFAGNQRFVVKATGDAFFDGGNVGIGTDGPSEKLHVAGNIFATGNISGSLTSTGSLGRLEIYGSNSQFEGLIKVQGSGNNIFTGNIGLNGINPDGYESSAKSLVLGATGAHSGMTIVAGSSQGGNIHFADGTSGNEQYRGYINYNHIDDSMTFGTAASDRVMIGSAGAITGSHYSGSSTSTGSFGTVEAAHFTGDGAGLTNVPDYVFESDYDLKSLSYVETFVSQSLHLPNVPGRDDFEGWKSYDVGGRDMLLLEKIEELTLYVIRLEKRIKKLENN